ncbi:MAG: hypothetical protein RID42_09305 [Alphaproteobacteria bacterium]
MIRPSLAIGLILLAVMVTGLFELKYEVRDLSQQKELLHKKIAEEQETLRVLHAEWSFLNQPERIQALVARYLDLGTPTASQVGGLERIPLRPRDNELAQAGSDAGRTR